MWKQIKRQWFENREIYLKRRLISKVDTSFKLELLLKLGKNLISKILNLIGIQLNPTVTKKSSYPTIQHFSLTSMLHWAFQALLRICICQGREYRLQSQLTFIHGFR